MSSFKFSSLSKMTSGKMSKALDKTFQNKYVLYFVFFLAFTNLLGYLMLSNYRAIIVFILIGYLMKQYTNNMIIVLAVPLILTSVLLVGSKVKEGMENKKKEEDAKKDDKKDAKKEDAKKEDDKNDDTKGEIDLKEEVKLKIKKAIDDHDAKHTDKNKDKKEPTGDEKDKKENYTGYRRNNNRLDYATTVEDAYGDLSNILGEGGIKGLTKDTEKLMSQQLELADAMKNMSPLLDQAKSMLQGFDLKSLNGIASLAKGFGDNTQDQ